MLDFHPHVWGPDGCGLHSSEPSFVSSTLCLLELCSQFAESWNYRPGMDMTFKSEMVWGIEAEGHSLGGAGLRWGGKGHSRPKSHGGGVDRKSRPKALERVCSASGNSENTDLFSASLAHVWCWWRELRADDEEEAGMSVHGGYSWGHPGLSSYHGPGNTQPCFMASSQLY